MTKTRYLLAPVAGRGGRGKEGRRWQGRQVTRKDRREKQKRLKAGGSNDRVGLRPSEVTREEQIPIK